MTKKNMWEKLKNRAKESVDANEKGSGSPWIASFKAEKYKLKSGKERNKIDIIPFLVRNPQYKNYRNKKGEEIGIEVGEMDYKLELPVHKNVGQNKKRCLCTKYLLGKKCIICDDIQAMRDNGATYDEIKDFLPKWNNLYNVVDIASGKREIKILELPYAWFETSLLKLMQEESDAEGEIIVPFSSEDGKTIVFKGEEETFRGKSFIKPGTLDFQDREKNYSDEFIEKYTISLDELVILPTEEDVKKILFSQDDEEGEGEGESEVKKIKKTEKINDCPYGFNFGDDWNEKKACDNKCKVKKQNTFMKCQKAYQDSIE